MTAIAAATGQAILADIIAHPGDDWLRLAYADWCEDGGQEARAEFIRAQVRLARHSAVPRGAIDHPDLILFSKRQPLLDIEERFLRSLPPSGVEERLWTRGFVSLVRCPLAAWLEHGRAICAGHPVEEASVGQDILPLEEMGPDLLSQVSTEAWGPMDAAQKVTACHLLGWCNDEIIRLLADGSPWCAETFNKGVSAGLISWARSIKR